MRVWQSVWRNLEWTIDMRHVIEPNLFALDQNISEEQFLRFVKQMLEWKDWLERRNEDIFILSDTEIILGKNNCYPMAHVAKRLMNSFNSWPIQGADIDQFMRNLGKKAKKIDLLCDKSEWEFIDASIEMENGSVLAKRSPSMAKALKRLLWFTYQHSEQQGIPIGSYTLFAKDLSGSMSVSLKGGKLVEKEGKLVIVDTAVSKAIACKSSLGDYFKGTETPLKICRYSADRQDLDLAVRIALFQQGGHKSIADVFKGYSFYIQKSYYKDFDRAHYSTDASFLRSWLEAMTEILQNKHLDKREDYRTGKGGNNPQQFHGQYAAWRWYVTQSVKMQYWQKDKNYRFANVKEHDIFVCEWED